jgi:hypothetical protein
MGIPTAIAPVIVEAASPHRKTASAPIFSGVV